MLYRCLERTPNISTQTEGQGQALYHQHPPTSLGEGSVLGWSCSSCTVSPATCWPCKMSWSFSAKKMKKWLHLWHLMNLVVAVNRNGDGFKWWKIGLTYDRKCVGKRFLAVWTDWASLVTVPPIPPTFPTPWVAISTWSVWADVFEQQLMVTLHSWVHWQNTTGPGMMPWKGLMPGLPVMNTIGTSPFCNRRFYYCSEVTRPLLFGTHILRFLDMILTRFRPVFIVQSSQITESKPWTWYHGFKDLIN